MKTMILRKDFTARSPFCLLIIVLTSIILISGCSKDLSRDKAKDLSRDKAKKMIISHFKSTTLITTELDVGSKIMANQMSPKWLESLKREGLIDYTYHQPYVLNHVVSVSLTDKGKKYVVGDTGTRGWPNAGQKYVNVKLAEREFVEITGIRAPGDKKEAVVEYNWKYANLSPFSKGWKGADYDEKKTHMGEAYFVLYDDGWRITELRISIGTFTKI
jgi:hypothetical protein